MTQEEALNLLSPRLYDVLRKMFDHFAKWRPKIGYPAKSAVFLNGGSVRSFEDLAEEVDGVAIRAIEAAYYDLSHAEKAMIEQVIGIRPWACAVNAEALESAIARLERQLMALG